MKRLRAKERFVWHGVEFKLSMASKTAAEWHAAYFLRDEHGAMETALRLCYRDIGDPDAPPEWTAFLRMHGFATLSALGKTPDEALDHVLNELRAKIQQAIRLFNEFA